MEDHSDKLHKLSGGIPGTKHKIYAGVAYKNGQTLETKKKKTVCTAISQSKKDEVYHQRLGKPEEIAKIGCLIESYPCATWP